MRYPLLLVLCLSLWLSACIGNSDSEEEDVPPAEDALTAVRAGLEALYSGNVEGINTHFCEEIVLSIRGQAAPAIQGEGNIDLSGAEFEVAQQQGRYQVIRLVGTYAVVLNGEVDVRNTDEIGAPLFTMQARDGRWVICDIGSEAPSGQPEAGAITPTAAP